MMAGGEMEQAVSADEEAELLADLLQWLLDNPQNSPSLLRAWEECEVREIYQCAYYFYQNGKYAEAEDCFRTLTAVDGKEIDYWMGLAAALKMQKKYARALETYTIAALIDHRNPALHAHAADCCFALGQIKRGLAAVASAEALAADDHKEQQLISQLALIRQAWSD